MDISLVEGLFAAIPDVPFFIKDSDLHYVAANGAMAELCGVRSPQMLHGRRAADFFSPERARNYEALDREVLATKRALTSVLDQSGTGKEKSWLQFARLPVLDSHGRSVGIAASAQRLRLDSIGEAGRIRLTQIVEHIQRDFSQPVRIAELVRRHGGSMAQVERDFRRIIGLTPLGFLHRVRHQAACRLLEHSGQSIAAIAQECGYSDHSAFTRRFSETAGCTPSEYRRRLSAPSSAGDGKAGQ